MLQEEGADLIDDARALADQALAHPVQRLQVQLIGGLRGHEPHRRALDGLGDRLRVAEVVLLPISPASAGDHGQALSAGG